ncbi:BA75_04578T0 [Komagataella pastoris]|uniref:BA75_04578T0 n=1 Tax=Komagataella pastoris TaxID=4922 RepID=A0A1B2JIB3_PICPA|nr:BA75_04578T0 [Komagataella pastoris]
MTELRVAVQGCAHGELDKIYERLKMKWGDDLPDLLIICGDFQAFRNTIDMDCASLTNKYKKLGDFHQYYTGEKKAPLKTIFIGGNHEASNYLTELPYGGYVAPNIYYMGTSGAVWFRGLRIMGWSGIYVKRDFYLPHNEKYPFNEGEKRSVYHSRWIDYLKLSLQSDIARSSIMITHDWPQGIEHFGDLRKLMQTKPFFRSDIENELLGSPPGRKLLEILAPNYWFSAHLHVRYEASFVSDFGSKRTISLPEKDHQLPNKRINVTELKTRKNQGEIELSVSVLSDESKSEVNNNDEIALDLSDVSSDSDSLQVNPAASSASSPQTTRFLALDKCKKNINDHLEVLSIPITDSRHESARSDEIFLDQEFLTIIKLVEKFKISPQNKSLDISSIRSELIQEVRTYGFKIETSLEVPKFQYDSQWSHSNVAENIKNMSKLYKSYSNPQTIQLQQMYQS